MHCGPPIALVGLMGSGKSAVAAALAARLKGRAADLDAAIEAAAGRPIAEIFAAEGESGFRSRETALLRATLAQSPVVLACGGGAVLDSENRALLAERCRVVWLEVSPEEAVRRIGEGAARRPLLGQGRPAARLAALLAERAPHYGQLAELRVPTDGRTPEQVADAVLAGLGIEPAGRPA